VGAKAKNERPLEERKNLTRQRGLEQCDSVSFAGAAVFKRVTKMHKRYAHLDIDPEKSVRTDACQTVRMTIRAGTSENESVLVIW